MNKMLVAVFETETAAYEGLRALRARGVTERKERRHGTR